MSDSIKTYTAVGLGGIMGAMMRYSLSLLIPSNDAFPYATLTANLIGCFLLSYLYNQRAIKERLSPRLFTALGTGVIGSFTTFSTFSIETIDLWQANGLLSLIYVVTSIAGGLGFCYLGYHFARRKEVQP